jgi:hypothetical protein
VHNLRGGHVVHHAHAATARGYDAGASDITTNNATLHADVYANGELTSAWFEFGTTTDYGSWSPSGYADGPISFDLFGILRPATAYHFRAAAHNSWGTAYGSDRSFTTLTMPSALVINCGSGYWSAGGSTLSYTGGSAQSFILLQSADPTAPLSAWTRVGTNDSTPGSFAIPPVGTAGPSYYRVMSE